MSKAATAPRIHAGDYVYYVGRVGPDYPLRGRHYLVTKSDQDQDICTIEGTGLEPGYHVFGGCPLACLRLVSECKHAVTSVYYNVNRRECPTCGSCWTEEEWQQRFGLGFNIRGPDGASE